MPNTESAASTMNNPPTKAMDALRDYPLHETKRDFREFARRRAMTLLDDMRAFMEETYGISCSRKKREHLFSR